MNLLRPASLATTLAAVVLLSACTGSEPIAVDPGSGSGAGPSAPSAAPAAPDQVRTANLATVMDTGNGPVELCLGPVAESYPPQCSGPAIPNWDWDTFGDGGFEEVSGVRWGLYSLTGTWDGEEFTVSDSIIAALYDSFVEEPTDPPTPATTYSAGELESIATETGDLPGAQGQYTDEAHVYLDVIYDDGSIQAYVDETYGADVVLVNSSLVDVE